MASKAEEKQVSLLESINQQMAENKAAIINLGQQIGKGDKQTSAEEAKERLKKPKTPGAGTDAGKKETIGQMASDAKSKGGGLLKMLGLGALGASLGLAFQDEIIGTFKKGMTDLFGGKDSLLGGAVNSIVGLLDNLQNPLGALTTGLAVGLNRFTAFVDKTLSKPIIDPKKVPTATRTQTTTTRTTTPDPDPKKTAAKGPDKPAARTAGQTRIENTDRARNLTKAQQAALEKKGFKVGKDGGIMKGSGMASAADAKKALDDVGAKGPSAKAVAAADEAAPKARASAAKVVGPGAAPAATSQVEVDKRMAAKPGGGGGPAPAAPAAPAAGAGADVEAKALKPATGGGAKPKPNAFIKIAKKVGAALKGIYDTVGKFVAKAGQYSGIKWVAKLGAKALGPIAALITLFMLGKNELDPSISSEEKLKNRFALLGEAAGGVLGGVIGALVLTLVFPGVGTAIGGVLGGIIGAFIGGNLGIFIYKCCRDGVVETLKSTFKSMKDLAKAALDYMKQKGIKGLAEDASELIGKGADYLAGLASSAAGAVADAAGATYDAAAEAASQVKDFAAEKASAAVDAVKESAVGQGAIAAADYVKESAVGKGVAALGGAIGSLFSSDDEEVEKPDPEKMAGAGGEVSPTNKRKGRRGRRGRGGRGGGKKVTDVSGVTARAATDEEKAEFNVPPITPTGPGAQAAGAQALGDAAAQQAGGGGTEDALAKIVEQNAQTSKAVVQALAKIDAKTGNGGGSGMPMMIPAPTPNMGGLGRKTVIGASP